MSKHAKPTNLATLLYRAKLEYLSSIVFHTILVAREYVKTCKTNKCGFIAIRAKLENLSSIVVHTILVTREYAKTYTTNKFGYIAIKSKTVVSIIDSIPRCPSGKKKGQNMQNQQIWLYSYIEQNWSFYHR